eukprot:10165184-Alexandrium_andersonii.AAC.1
MHEGRLDAVRAVEVLLGTVTPDGALEGLLCDALHRHGAGLAGVRVLGNGFVPFVGATKGGNLLLPHRAQGLPLLLGP